SLAYSYGTHSSVKEFKPMSKADIEFLEKVIKEGIFDEGERVGEVLNEKVVGREEEKKKDISEDNMLDMFQELQDIVEQIDYA
ncbi:hypothetical protein ACHAWX_000133, partial [Stephanocyclus meneghinianus]